VPFAHVRFDAVFLRPLVFFRPPLDFLRDGTFAPFARASDKPMAIACFRLVTLPPLPPRPLAAFPSSASSSLARLAYSQPLRISACSSSELPWEMILGRNC